MIWFQRLFPAAMFLMPWLHVLVLSPRHGHAEDGALSATAVRARRRLLLMTLALLGLHIAALSWLEANWPVYAAPRVVFTSVSAVVGSLLLWFAFAMPALQRMMPATARRTEQGSVGAGSGGVGSAPAGASAVRAASLVPRQQLSPIPPTAWLLGWLLFAGLIGFNVWCVTQGATPLHLLSASFWLVAGPCSARLALTEAEPRDAGGSPELEQAYASLRSLKVWGFFWFGLLGTALFTGIAALSVFTPQHVAWAGALLGSSLGIGGGLFGTLATMRRLRIQALLNRLQATPPQH
ncbi:MAG: hypothetical protein ACT4PU_10120 [Planctomycetota bacterium]